MVGKVWNWLKALRYGEVVLWLAFGLSGLGGAVASSDTTLTFSGLCLLAVIGLRATRPEREGGAAGDV